MAIDNTEPQDVDLERTDQLPVLNLNPALIDDDVADDAVRLDMASVVPRIKTEFQRAQGVDLLTLTESVRSLEERISRQKADFDALSQAHEKVRAAEQAAIARVNVLSAEQSTLRGLLETEQSRSSQLDKALADKTATADTLRSHVEDALREVDRHKGEACTLRDTLVARDATIVQVLHSLGERDAQLHALQREHARLVPALEERSRLSVTLENDLRNAVSRADATAADLRTSQASVATLTERIKSNELELAAVRRELSNAKLLAATHQERLRTRAWREGFDQNLVGDLDAKLNAAQSDRGVLKASCDQLRQRVAELESILSVRDETITTLQAASEHEQAQRARNEIKASQVEAVRGDLMQRIAALEAEHGRLTGELAAKDQSLADAQTVERTELRRRQDELVLAEQTHAALRAEAARLQADLHAREEEMGVLHAHLEAARRPRESLDVESQRGMDELAAKTEELAAKTEELAAKTRALELMREENRNLNTALERTRVALDEREFLIRRLERRGSNNVGALGRNRTGVERMGAAPGVPANSATPAECAAEMVRIDGDSGTTHVLGRRTRIGRAPGCEIQIDSSSVSRHHALILVGMREVIVEDLNSTNGVLVNGRKVARQLLSDGDQLTIGEAQFRLYLKLDPRPPVSQSTSPVSQAATPEPQTVPTDSPSAPPPSPPPSDTP
jgi:chromosome segregation ATPase